MAIKRINYTRRRKIRSSDISVILRRETPESIPQVELQTKLSSYKFPESATISVEAYRQTNRVRFAWGTVGRLEAPEYRKLEDFDSEDEILFRVKVTDAALRKGVLLGVADQIRPVNPEETPDNRIALLPPVPEDLGQDIWRIDFEGPPMLKVNKLLPNWKDVVRTQSFRALVYPGAVRIVLTRILIIEQYTSTDDPCDWRSQWLRFCMELPGVAQLPKDGGSHGDWIEDCARAYARKFSMRDRFESDQNAA